MATRRNPRSSATHCRGACVHVWLRGLDGLREKHIDRVVFEALEDQLREREPEYADHRVSRQNQLRVEEISRPNYHRARQPAHGPRSPSGSQSTIPGCPTTISSAKAKIRS